jgi:hypothetical protein
MNKDIGRKLIAIVASDRRSVNEYLEKDFINVLSYKRKMISEENVKRFLTLSKELGLVSENAGKYQPNFNAKGVIVPIDFVFTEAELFEEKEDLNFMDRLLDAITASGKMSKKEALNQMKEHLKELKYIDNEERLLSIMIDNGIKIDDFVDEIKERYMNNGNK